MLIYYKHDERVYPSLPLITVMKYLNLPPDSIKYGNEDTIELRTASDTLFIPVDGRNQTLINFISEADFHGRIISMKNFLESSESTLNGFLDKIVLIGDSKAPNEISPGPRGEPYPNLFIYASLISQILNNQGIKHGIFESLILSLIGIALGLIWLFFFQNRSKRIKVGYIYLIAFLGFFIFSFISLNFRTKTYLILPYVVFCMAYVITHKYYSRKISKAQESEVFISYSHRDSDFARKLKSALEAQGITIDIDIETLKFGENIKEFINKSMRHTEFTISIVSKNSLKSPWVIKESLETLLHEKVEGERKFIPIYIDKSFSDINFQGKIIDFIDTRLQKVKQETKKAFENNAPTEFYDSERKKLMDLRNNIGKILHRLNESLSADFSTRAKFDENLAKLVDLIKNRRKNSNRSQAND